MLISKRDIKLLIVLGGIVLFVVLYFGVNGYIDSLIQETETDIDMLAPELMELENHEANLAEYRETTENAKAYANEQLEFYPAMIKNEDYLVWLLDWEGDIGLDMETVTLHSPSEMVSFLSHVIIDGQDTVAQATAYSMKSNISGIISYNQFKSSLDYIYGFHDRTSVENANLNYDSGTGELTFDMTLTKYYLYYDGAQYIPSEMPNVPQGLDILFGSLEDESAPVEQSTTTAETPTT